MAPSVASPSIVRTSGRRLHGEHEAAADRLAVDDHGAGAADAVLATDMGPRQPQVLAQEVGEGLARLDRSPSGTRR